jgi:hypothetical protein
MHYYLIVNLVAWTRVVFDKTLGKFIPFDEWQKNEIAKSYRKRISAGLRVPQSEKSPYDFFQRVPASRKDPYDFSQ